MRHAVYQWSIFDISLLLISYYVKKLLTGQDLTRAPQTPVGSIGGRGRRNFFVFLCNVKKTAHISSFLIKHTTFFFWYHFNVYTSITYKTNCFRFKDVLNLFKSELNCPVWYLLTSLWCTMCTTTFRLPWRIKTPDRSAVDPCVTVGVCILYKETLWSHKMS